MDMTYAEAHTALVKAINAASQPGMTTAVMLPPEVAQRLRDLCEEKAREDLSAAQMYEKDQHIGVLRGEKAAMRARLEMLEWQLDLIRVALSGRY